MCTRSVKLMSGMTSMNMKYMSGKSVHVFSEIDVGYDKFEHEIRVRERCACVQ